MLRGMGVGYLIAGNEKSRFRFSKPKDFGVTENDDEQRVETLAQCGGDTTAGKNLFFFPKPVESRKYRAKYWQQSRIWFHMWHHVYIGP